MDIPHLFIHSSVNEHLGCFYFLAIVNNVLCIFMYKFLCGHVLLISLGYLPVRGIAGSYGNSMFNFLRYHKTIFKVTTPFYIPSRSV